MKSLFVGNMSFQTTDTDLRTLFSSIGQVTRIQVVTDRETGCGRGFAFVEMSNDDEAARAITALDGWEMAGRNLKVNEARPTTTSSAKPFQGGRRGPGAEHRNKFSNEDYRESARQPREPRW
jgi:RNA recognition motif-containing protein